MRFQNRNAVLHLALFVPWEKFQNEPADSIPGLWPVFEAQLSDRVRSNVRNIALPRISAEDTRADQKLQGIDKDIDEAIDTHALGDQGEEGSGFREDYGSVDVHRSLTMPS